MQTDYKFYVINTRTKAVVSKCVTKQGARNAQDRADNKYGAYVHIIKEI